MAEEVEIKLSLSPDHVPTIETALLKMPGAVKGRSIAMRNTYFDSPDGQLNREMMALRLRDSGGTPLQTLKTRGAISGGVASRGEWEWPLTEYALDYQLLQDTPLADHPALGTLQACFDTHFTRQLIDLYPEGRDGTRIECALDSGSVEAGDKQQPLCELELELKKGDAQRLQRVALQVAEHAPLFLNTISKAEQGYFLAGLYRPQVSDSDSADCVDTWLHALSVHWLLDDPATWPQVQQLHQELADRAEQAGVYELWQIVAEHIQQLADAHARPRRALMGIPELAPLQLSLALG